MKRKRALLIAFVLCITFGLTACQDVENDAVKPMDIVEKFFLAFEVSVAGYNVEVFAVSISTVTKILVT